MDRKYEFQRVDWLWITYKETALVCISYLLGQAVSRYGLRTHL